MSVAVRHVSAARLGDPEGPRPMEVSLPAGDGWLIFSLELTLEEVYDPARMTAAYQEILAAVADYREARPHDHEEWARKRFRRPSPGEQYPGSENVIVVTEVPGVRRGLEG